MRLKRNNHSCLLLCSRTGPTANIDVNFNEHSWPKRAEILVKTFLVIIIIVVVVVIIVIIRLSLLFFYCANAVLKFRFVSCNSYYYREYVYTRRPRPRPT
jgi:hypothetical protein